MHFITESLAINVQPLHDDRQLVSSLHHFPRGKNEDAKHFSPSTEKVYLYSEEKHRFLLRHNVLLRFPTATFL